MAYRPKFSISPRLALRLEEISALREKVKGALVQVAWIPALQKDARSRNAHASTAIEGNPLTLEEVRVLEEGKPLPSATERARREILNYLAGLRFIERRFAKRPVAHADVLRLHKVLSSGVMDQGEAGRYRRFRVRVGRYYPPPPADVRLLMTDLLEWWNGNSAEWPAVISSAVLHFRFEEIHPFGDGNGRTGRLLALWELYRRGFDTHHVFAVDEYFWENRPLYYAALDGVRERDGDITGFLEFSAEAVRWALEQAWLRIQAVGIGVAGARVAGEEATGAGVRLLLRPKQERLLVLLRDRGPMPPREIWSSLGVSKQGALDLLRPLLDAGLVRRAGTRKSGRYGLAQVPGPS